MDPVQFYSPGPLQEDNMGGLWYMRYAIIEGVSACEPPVQNVCTSDLTWNTDVQSSWLTLPITVDSGNFDEDIAPGANGTDYIARWSGHVAKVDVYKMQLLHQVQRHWLIVEVQDNNGFWRRLGDLRNPCRASIAEALGGQASARNGFTISIEWRNDQAVPFVDTTYTPSFDHLESSTSSGMGGGGGA